MPEQKQLETVEQCYARCEKTKFFTECFTLCLSENGFTPQQIFNLVKAIKTRK